MANEVRVVLDIEGELAKVLLIGADLAAQGARYMVDEVKNLIETTDIPSEPGTPPHSSGRLRDSFFASQPKKRKDGSITAYAWSRLGVGKQNVPLALVLDQGLGPIAPRPFLAAAARLAQEKLDQDVARVNQQLRNGR